MHLDTESNSAPWDLERLRIPLDRVGLAEVKHAPPRHRPGEPFLKGPIPFDWMATACRLGSPGRLGGAFSLRSVREGKSLGTCQDCRIDRHLLRLGRAWSPCGRGSGASLGRARAGLQAGLVGRKPTGAGSRSAESVAIRSDPLELVGWCDATPWQVAPGGDGLLVLGGLDQGRRIRVGSLGMGRVGPHAVLGGSWPGVPLSGGLGGSHPPIGPTTDCEAPGGSRKRFRRAGGGIGRR